jgi:D-alanyl-D-alanine carboxypeptidase/D-alanyl-D-alanine-endopeptidase (penicillin-binding protein 4)
MKHNLTIFRYLYKLRLTPAIFAALAIASCAPSRYSAPRVELTYEYKGESRQLRPAIDRILDDSVLTPAFIGIKIVTADSGEVLYERNESKLFHPASNEKLLTTAASLRFLGSWYKFETTLRMDGTIRDSILDGNLIVKGCGDPLITGATLDSFATVLAARGIRSITGDLVGDISAFDTVSWGEGWMWDDEPSTDAAFISPLTVNSNSIDVHVVPGRRTGDRPRVSCDPAVDIFQVVNDAVTTNDTTLPDLLVDRRKGENVIRGELIGELGFPPDA